MRDHRLPIALSKRRGFKPRLCAVIGLVVVAIQPAGSTSASTLERRFAWEEMESPPGVFLDALDVVSADTVWLAGSTDEYAYAFRSIDGGETFDEVGPPAAGYFYINEIEAFSDDEALVVGEANHVLTVFRTTDGGESWTTTFTGVGERLAELAMFDRRRGYLVLGEPVEQKFQIFVTSDSGQTWEQAPTEGIPLSPPDELVGATDATGRSGFFVTADGASRVFRTTDFGWTWQAYESSIPYGTYAVAFRTNRLGVVAGGYPDPRIARTKDGGRTWRLVDDRREPTTNSGSLDWWSDRRGSERGVPADQRVVVMVSFDGSTVSVDRGRSWTTFGRPFAEIDCAEGSPACWAVGNGPGIGRLVVGES